MHKILSFLLPLMVLPFFFGSTEASGIKWTESYEEGVQQSKKESKPMILFFTGSDWCGWCTKLENEVFDTQAFAESAGNDYVFVKLDYPMNKTQDMKIVEQNKQLQKKYDIRSYPTIVVLDPTQQQIAITGYRAGGGAEYSKHLKKIVDEYKEYKAKVTKLDDKASGTELKSLYKKANEFQAHDDIVRIVNIGMKSDRHDFFQMERYRMLGKEGMSHSAEALALKEQLLANDPDNSHLTHYQVACIDFNACSEEMNKNSTSAEVAVAPLSDYVKAFGEKDKENIWRIEMIIAQVYQDQNEIEKALNYARSALSNAPESMKSDIALAIEQMHAK